MLEDVIRHSSFDFMKQNTKTYLEKLDKMPDEMIRNDPDIPDDMRDMLLSDKREIMKNDAKLIRKAPLTGSACNALLEKDKRTTQTRNSSHHVQN
ncbi:hypothetical protein AVEN_9217-1 [Araneus ventricosus]|uniref:Uncharacterized protein n=1 Tax=Araneus ventricosus TaxID=182803 RepID=A0A4Y2UZ88_ARAVE|nr:hypothetical protein AVEN_9217-1 [Araneus ventricosus]